MTLSIPGGDSPAPDAFTGRAVLVTGAGDGLGRETALGAARCGAEAILLGRTVRKLEAVHDRIVEAGARRRRDGEAGAANAGAIGEAGHRLPRVSGGGRCRGIVALSKALDLLVG